MVPQAIRIDAGKKQSEAFPRTRQSILQALERITRSRVAANALSVIYSFPNPRAGAKPRAGLIMDAAGNLYGGTLGAQNTEASVFELSRSGNSWQLTVLHSFTSGLACWGNLVLDSSGNLYGTTYSLGTHGMGNIFKLSPSGGGWTYTDLYDFSNNGDGENPTGDLTIDSSGNIYGTNLGENGHGVVWELTP